MKQGAKEGAAQVTPNHNSDNNAGHQADEASYNSPRLNQAPPGGLGRDTSCDTTDKYACQRNRAHQSDCYDGLVHALRRPAITARTWRYRRWQEPASTPTHLCRSSKA